MSCSHAADGRSPDHRKRRRRLAPTAARTAQFPDSSFGAAASALQVRPDHRPVGACCHTAILVDPASSICLSQNLSHACISPHGWKSETANKGMGSMICAIMVAKLKLKGFDSYSGAGKGVRPSVPSLCSGLPLVGGSGVVPPIAKSSRDLGARPSSCGYLYFATMGEPRRKGLARSSAADTWGSTSTAARKGILYSGPDGGSPGPSRVPKAGGSGCGRSEGRWSPSRLSTPTKSFARRNSMGRKRRSLVLSPGRGSSSGPAARSCLSPGPRKRRRRLSGSLDRVSCSPSVDRPWANIVDARWSASGVPPHGSASQRGRRPLLMGRIGAEALTESVGGSVGLSGTTRVVPALSVPKAKKRLFKSSRNSLTLFSLDPGKRGGYLSNRTLMEISFPYRPQGCDICSVHLATAFECCTHLRKAHGLTKPLLVCSVCGKMGRRRHEIECHAAKCTRTRGTRTQVVNRVRCSLCDRTFRTQRGLSLHRRSAHTADYMAQLARPADGQDAPKRRKWSDEEVVTLKEHLDKWKTKRGLLDMACTLLPGRTKGQIQYNVAQVRKAARLPALPGPSQPYQSLIEELMTEEVQPEVPRSIVVRGILRALAGGEGERRFGSSLVQSERDTQTALTDLARACKSMRGRIMNAGRVRTLVGRSRTTGVQRFRLTQREMIEETKKLARLILDGSEVGICPLSTRVVEDHFRSKWEGEDGFKGIGQFRAGQFCSNYMLAIPISPAEVLKARKESKRGSAAGPDGVDKVSLVKWDPSEVKLARMYTRFLVTQKIPEPLKENRTALIPKSSDATALQVVSNWRPITIGSMVLRLFSSILYKRLSDACTTCVRQKGFSNTPGCSENLLLVEGALKSSSKTGSPLAMVFIDLAKAFDSVSHRHIRAALVQR